MVNKLLKEEEAKNNQEIENNNDNNNDDIVDNNKEDEVPIFKDKDKELWRVGVICKKDCFYLTEEILKILKNNGYEWKLVSSSYRIKCRRRFDENNKDNEIYSKINPLVVEIKIFGEVDPNIKDEFLVDIHKRAGSVMEFLQFSSNLISSLQKEGLIVFK